MSPREAGPGGTIGADALRPERLSEFAGQADVIRELGYVLAAARAEDRLPSHLLLAGPPGLGKTTLAKIIARELGVPLFETSGPAIDKPADIANVLTALKQPSAVFVDEIHALPRLAEELLYPAMEDGQLDITIGEGRSARSVRLPLAPFVLIGATTQTGRLSAPLRMRFTYVERLRLYGVEDLAAIVARSASLLGIDIEPAGAAEIAGRSQGTPRVANNNLRQVRDFARAEGHEEITEVVAVAGLEAFGVDPLGLDHLGREILTALCQNFSGGPVGLKTLAASVGEAPSTLEDEYEPYFMRAGLIARTPRGRIATARTFEHLGLEAPAAALLAEAGQESLFGGGGAPEGS